MEEIIKGIYKLLDTIVTIMIESDMLEHAQSVTLKVELYKLREAIKRIYERSI